MVAGMVVGAIGGGNAGPVRALWVDGLDVRLKPTTGGNAYGVPVDTISVNEVGPGGVSSMSFTIEDPLAEVTIAEGAIVVFEDLPDSLPDFRGFLNGPIVARPWGVGRVYDCRATGPEALLDWLVITADVTFPVNTEYIVAVQALCAQASGGFASPLRCMSVGKNSTQAGPTGDCGTTFLGLSQAVTVTAGTSLREGLRQIGDVANMSNYSKGSQGGPFVTVDMWWGLRTWGVGGVLNDYADLTITDTAAGPIRAGSLGHTIDATATPRALYVKGGNAAGSGLVPNGAGRPGPTPTLDDATILTSSARDDAAAAYFGARVTAVRGDLVREHFIRTDTVAAHVQAGSDVIINDANVGLTGQHYRIMGIAKTYSPGNSEDWRITYGALPPSIARGIRRLTRGVRS